MGYKLTLKFKNIISFYDFQVTFLHLYYLGRLLTVPACYGKKNVETKGHVCSITLFTSDSNTLVRNREKCDGPNVTLFIHMTSFTKNDKKTWLISHVCVKNVVYIPSHSSYMIEYMCKKCHVWSIREKIFSAITEMT